MSEKKALRHLSDVHESTACRLLPGSRGGREVTRIIEGNPKKVREDVNPGRSLEIGPAKSNMPGMVGVYTSFKRKKE